LAGIVAALGMISSWQILTLRQFSLTLLQQTSGLSDDLFCLRRRRPHLPASTANNIMLNMRSQRRN